MLFHDVGIALWAGVVCGPRGSRARVRDVVDLHGHC